MGRRGMLLIAMVTVTMLTASGVAWAATVSCSGSGACYGTADGDEIQGTDGNDQIFGFAGNDEIRGSGGGDSIYGGGGSDLLVGGSGRDDISALETIGGPGNDTIRAGGGNDRISATDDYKDKINCGSGRDTVYYDKGRDTVDENCELAYPIP